MAVRFTSSRILVLGLLASLLLIVMPISPVVAQEVAPETVNDVVEGLDIDAAASGTDAVVSEAKQTSMPFNSIGVKADGDPTVSFRTRSLDGDWRAWQTVEPLDELDGPDEGSAEEAQAEAVLPTDGWVSDAIWVGDSDHIQLRVERGDLDDVEVHTIDSMGLSETLWQRVSRKVQSLTAPAPAEAASYPGLITRSQWGADESMRRGSPSYATVRFAVVHHTAGSNSYTQAQAAGVVRGIYSWHVNGNGWSDVGYNILVDRYGNVYEGRFGGIDRGVIGAHAANFNTGSFGVGVMGNFDTAQVPTAAFNAVRNVMAWKYDVHGIDANPSRRVTANGRTIPVLVGHRDVGTTACPGRYFYSRLDELRRGIESRVTTAQATAPAPAPAPAPEPAQAWQPVVGDWNGDGRTNVGWFRDGSWRLWPSFTSTGQALQFRYGRAGDLPVVGDWNGNGTDTVGIVRDGTWHLNNSNAGGTSDVSFTYGRVTQGDIPIVGDWTGDGRDTIGIVRDGEWHLRDSLSGGHSHFRFVYGRVTRGDIPIVGDWNRDGRDTAGIVRDGTWHLRNSHAGGASDTSFVYGRVSRGDVPVTGDWNRDRRTTPGIMRGGTWLLRNGNSGGSADITFEYR